MTTGDVVLISTLLITLASLVAFFEDVAIPHQILKGGVLDWRYCLAFQPHRLPVPDSWSDRLFGACAFRFAIACRLLAALVMVVFSTAPCVYLSVAATLYLLCHVYLMYRMPYSLDGADQMVLVVMAGIVLMSFRWFEPRLAELGMMFVTAQLVIAYATAAASKASGQAWRSGRGLAGILSTAMFGNAALSKWIRHDRVALAMSWSAIVLLGSTAVGLVVGGECAYVALAVAMLFHISVAIIMDLNLFVWTFAAAFPSAIYTASWSVRLSLFGG